MSEIVIFDDEEGHLVAEALAFAARREPEYSGFLSTARRALQSLAHSISQYPAVTGTQVLRRRSRNVDTLVESLCRGSANERALQTPTRAILGKAFLTAKIHFLCLIRDMYGSHALRRRRARQVTDRIFANVFTIMSEEVCLCILENHRDLPGLRLRAARELAHIWEWRLTRNAEQFAPVLFSLWQSRRTLRPIYGTMMGSSELMHVAARAHPRWLDFLTEQGSCSQTAQALEEFLFDLSYEELCLVRDHIRRESLAAVHRKDVSAILGREDGSPEGSGQDARAMYASFQQRKADAQFRVRAGLQGPTKTIEELLMSFLLSRESPGVPPPSLTAREGMSPG